eukprot:TRINITY_DN6143_c0_g1_i4.p1 TRINITY_DN6143_c0_g1~~TRINITY_DN6143_c0_g1_i4.p1  ORF type:complete len:831 (-),score=219.76 TRINITY_DN6143_c0_g1_i4:37-2529(-)
MTQGKIWGDHTLLATLLKQQTPQESSNNLEKLQSLIINGPSSVRKNIQLLNTLINCWSKNQNLRGIDQVLSHMKSQSLKPDVYTYTILMNSYSHLGSDQVLELLSEMKQASITPNRVSWNVAIKSLISEKPSQAIQLFEEMRSLGIQPDAYSWNILLEAHRKVSSIQTIHATLRDMANMGSLPNHTTYCIALAACSDQGDVAAAIQIWRQSRDAGIVPDSAMWNAFLQIVDKMEDPSRIVDEVKSSPTVPSLINYAHLAQQMARRGQDVISFLSHMRERGIQPDARMYTILITTAVQKSDQTLIDHLYRDVCGKNILDGQATTALMDALIKGGRYQESAQIWERALAAKIDVDIPLWNVVIDHYGSSGDVAGMKGAFDKMIQMGHVPNAITWNNIVPHLLLRGKLKDASEMWDKMIRAGIEPTESVYIGLMNAYGRIGEVERVNQLFREMGQKSPTPISSESWVSLIRSLGQVADHNAIDKVLMESRGESDPLIRNAAIVAFSTCNLVSRSWKIFNSIPKKDKNVAAYTSMLQALSQQGSGQEALQLFQEMIDDKIAPTEPAIVAVLNGCSHSGLVEQGKQIYASLSDFGIYPSTRLGNVMVDLLGRAHLMDDARQFADAMESPNVVTWITLLGAARNQNNIAIAEYATQKAISINDSSSAAYVLMGNAYATSKMPSEMKKIRGQMDGKEIRKLPGRTWLMVDGELHSFVVDDDAHPDIASIRQELRTLTQEMKNAGYKFNKEVLLREFENEEAEEDHLCRHSEKLAITYALLKTPSGTPITATNNLRVCLDCHEATKIISKIRNRKIAIRDASRWHHFEDGKCSCGDHF